LDSYRAGHGWKESNRLETHRVLQRRFSRAERSTNQEVVVVNRKLRRLALVGLLALASAGLAGVTAGPAGAASAQPDQVQPVSRNIVISQVSTQGPGGRFDEFIELENIGTAPINIAGYTLSACTAVNMVVPLVMVQSPTQLPPEPGQPPEAVVLQPGERWLIANLAGYTRGLIPNQTFTTEPTDPALAEIQSRGGVLLRAAPVVGTPTGQYVDAVGFTQGLQCTETAPARAQAGFADQANLRVNPVDTNVNRRDFIVYGPTSATNVVRGR